MPILRGFPIAMCDYLPSVEFGPSWFRSSFVSRTIWGFPKIGVPPNHQFSRDFPYKPSILEIPYLWKPSFRGFLNMEPTFIHFWWGPFSGSPHWKKWSQTSLCMQRRGKYPVREQVDAEYVEYSSGEDPWQPLGQMRQIATYSRSLPIISWS